jgi:hypothetical protein
MPPTNIIECNRCGGLLLAPKTQKTRTCPYCNTKIYLHKAKQLADAENALEASQILRKLKAQRQDNSRKIKEK